MLQKSLLKSLMKAYQQERLLQFSIMVIQLSLIEIVGTIFEIFEEETYMPETLKLFLIIVDESKLKITTSSSLSNVMMILEW